MAGWISPSTTPARWGLAPLPGVALGDWNDTLAINLTSAFLGAKYQIPALAARGGGSLIFTSTFVGHTVGMPGMGAYAASKAGLIGLTQVIAAECGSQGIRANALLPGGTDTPMGRAAMRAGRAPVRREPARAEAPGRSGGDCARGAVPGLRRFKLRHRHGDAGGWRRLHSSRLSAVDLPTRAETACIGGTAGAAAAIENGHIQHMGRAAGILLCARQRDRATTRH
jgi:NAD(P)-dependent dehydrogenase (short-subunit alcohol dehydrogenase family)